MLTFSQSFMKVKATIRHVKVKSNILPFSIFKAGDLMKSNGTKAYCVLYKTESSLHSKILSISSRIFDWAYACLIRALLITNTFCIQTASSSIKPILYCLYMAINVYSSVVH